MPRSPINTEVLVNKRNLFLARPSVYKTTGGHPGIDIHSPLGEDWFACVPGVIHLVNKLKTQIGLGSGDPSYSRYGAAICVDWGQADGSLIRFLYGHGRNRRKELDGVHVEDGRFLCESGNTGYTTGPHLHFEMRHYPVNKTGKFYDGTLKRRYNLLNPEAEFFKKHKIAYKYY